MFWEEVKMSEEDGRQLREESRLINLSELKGKAEDKVKELEEAIGDVRTHAYDELRPVFESLPLASVIEFCEYDSTGAKLGYFCGYCLTQGNITVARDRSLKEGEKYLFEQISWIKILREGSME